MMVKKMNKIIELSTNGFKLDEWYDSNDLGYTKKWFTCDNFKIIKKGLFKQLKLGDIVNDIVEVKGKDDKLYVTSFTVSNDMEGGDCFKSSLKSHNLGSVSPLPSSSSLPLIDGVDILEREGVDRFKPPVKNVSLPSVQDNIRYAQCVNIAFNSIGICDLTFKDDFLIVKAFDIADKIYIEFNKRCLR